MGAAIRKSAWWNAVKSSLPIEAHHHVLENTDIEKDDTGTVIGPSRVWNPLFNFLCQCESLVDKEKNLKLYPFPCLIAPKSSEQRESKLFPDGTAVLNDLILRVTLGDKKYESWSEFPDGDQNLTLDPSHRTMLWTLFSHWITSEFCQSSAKDLRYSYDVHAFEGSIIYGTCHYEHLLRTMKGGRLKSQDIGGQEFPLFLKDMNEKFPIWEGKKEEIQEKYLALGNLRANGHIGHLLFGTLMLREHNRIAKLLESEYKEWDDERIYQLTKTIVLMMLIKLIALEYLGLQAPAEFDPEKIADPRENVWAKSLKNVPVEYNLVAHWNASFRDVIRVPLLDSKAPDSEKGEAFTYGGKKEGDHVSFHLADDTSPWSTRLIGLGVGAWIHALSQTTAGLQGAKCNVPTFLYQDELTLIRQGRECGIQSYNEYRKFFNLTPCRSFEDLTGERELAAKLKKHYSTVNDVELFVGIRCERKVLDGHFGEVQYLILSQIFYKILRSHPLLSWHLWNERSLTRIGWQQLESLNFEILFKRNTMDDPVWKLKLPKFSYNGKIEKEKKISTDSSCCDTSCSSCSSCFRSCACICCDGSAKKKDDDDGSTCSSCCGTGTMGGLMSTRSGGFSMKTFTAPFAIPGFSRGGGRCACLKRILCSLPLILCLVLSGLIIGIGMLGAKVANPGAFGGGGGGSGCN